MISQIRHGLEYIRRTYGPRGNTAEERNAAKARRPSRMTAGTVYPSFSQGVPAPAHLPRITYGADKTIHQTGTVDIQVNWETREIKAVWFRCLNLPFKVSDITAYDLYQHVINPYDKVAIEGITYVRFDDDEH